MMRCSLLVPLTLVLTGCAHPLANVKNTTAHYAPSVAASSDVRVAEQHILAGEKLQPQDSLAAIGEYLRAADSALAQLRQHPGDLDATWDYDFALARVFSTIRKGNINAWSKPLAVPGYVITHRKDARVLWDPVNYEFIPCDELTIGGTAFTERARRKGIGATLLAIREIPVKDFQKRFLRTAHVYYGVTATATFQGNRCEISFDIPCQRNVNLAGRDFSLAGDFSTSVAMFLVREQPEKLGFARLVHPDKYKDTTLLFRLQPYDPRKIPVLFVHGLQDTAATWMPMLNALLDDPQIRNNYQFWFFTYPTGDPFPYSAALLRHDLDKFEKAYPDHKPIVIVGHSMGGLLTRLMLTDSCVDEMWRYLFNLPPAETPLSQEDKELLASALIFKHRPDINRAIFLSTPHRGSELASNWIGKIGTRLVHLPKKLVEAGQEMTAVAAETKGGFHLHRMPNSIDALSPTSSFVIAVNKRPLTSSIPYHQIIGDRGKGNSPNSSDGVVAYWSSHLDGARSTLIVPSAHPTHKSPEGIEEVRRILKLHLRSRPAGSIKVASELANIP